MWWTISKAVLAAAILVTVSEIANRYPRLGALLLTLPVASILAFVFTWTRHGDMETVSRLAQETLVLVPLGLPLFVPLAFSERLGLSFWPALLAGIGLASLTIGSWFWFGPETAS